MGRRAVGGELQSSTSSSRRAGNSSSHTAQPSLVALRASNSGGSLIACGSSGREGPRACRARPPRVSAQPWSNASVNTARQNRPATGLACWKATVHGAGCWDSTCAASARPVPLRRAAGATKNSASDCSGVPIASTSAKATGAARAQLRVGRPGEPALFPGSRVGVEMIVLVAAVGMREALPDHCGEVVAERLPQPGHDVPLIRCDPAYVHYLLDFSAVGALESAAMNASWGTSTRPTIFIRFLPSFCFSSSLRLRVISPP